MSNHRFTYLALTTEPAKHTARCRCGFVTGQYLNMQDVEDEVRRHEEYVQRVLAHLGPRSPSLKGQRDYYRKMADDPEVPKKERLLWAQLADELDRRLNDGPPSEDEPLFR